MDNKFPSISVGVIINGEVAYLKAYGYANKQSKIPATIKTVYQIGSLTKTFTGNLFAKYVIQSKVFLFDSLKNIFPSHVVFPTDNHNISGFLLHR